MAWIESHQALGQHPKTRKLARKLGCSVPAAVGHLQFLWWWALDYAPDGDVSRFEEDDIADAVLWEGAGDAFVAALVDSGFIDLNGDAKRIHDWDEYAGRLLDKRAANTRRKQESRARHTHVTRDTPVTPAPVTGLPTQPTNPTNRTEPTLPTEPCADGAGSSEPRVRHKPIDESFLSDLQDENPTVNVREVYQRVQNRKTWDGYKDKRRALRDHVGYALAERTNGNGRAMGTGTNGNRRGGDPQDDPELKRLRALGIIHE